MIFKRVAQTFSEPGIDSAAWTVPNGNPGRILLFQDVNSLYPTTMRQALPVGRPVVYTRESEEIGFKREKFYNDGSNASENSFKWLNEMQQYFSKKIQTGNVELGNSGIRRLNANVAQSLVFHSKRGSRQSSL